jgi:saccharopine dehydrogenase-like NADP-dependent oxidoreductase
MLFWEKWLERVVGVLLVISSLGCCSGDRCCLGLHRLVGSESTQVEGLVQVPNQIGVQNLSTMIVRYNTIFVVWLATACVLVITADAFSFESLRGKKVLVVGGSGRVGGSVVTQLIRHGAGLVVVGGTNPDRFQQAQQRWQRLFPHLTSSLADVSFVALNRDDTESVVSALQQHQQQQQLPHSCRSAFDLVVHTAGPFQGKVGQSAVLEACLTQNIAYVDVCDDYDTARAAKTRFDDMARSTNTPCLLSTGCWPGVSSLMAKQLVHTALARHPSLRSCDLSVELSFFTAGSGGAGVTLLVATFLILAEQALTIVNGRRIGVPPMTGYATIDFGTTVGQQDVAHLNLLETASLHDNLRLANVASRFGTAPPFWNALLGVMAQLPTSWLLNEELMRNLSIFSLPIVRLVDTLAGATNAMRCDVKTPKSTKAAADDSTCSCYTAIYAHENLEPCVGECVVAFCAAVLGGAVPPGVHFPEEAIPAGPDLAQVLALASVGAHTEVHVSRDGTSGDDDDDDGGGTTAATQLMEHLAPESVWGTRPESNSTPVLELSSP